MKCAVPYALVYCYLSLLTLGMSRVGSAGEECPFKTRILRTKDLNQRIVGLAPTSASFPIEVQKVNPLEFESKIEFSFEPQARTLIYNEAPVMLYPLASGGQGFTISVKMNQKTFLIKFIAIGVDSFIVEENIIVAVPHFSLMEKDPFTPPPTRELKSMMTQIDKLLVPRISAGPYFSFFRVDATDQRTGSQATAVSKYNVGLALGASIKLNRKIEPKASILVTHYAVTPISGASFDSTASQLLLNVGTGVNYYPSFKLPLLVGIEIGYFEETLLRGVDTATLRLERVGLVRVALNGSYAFYEKKKISLGVEGLLYYLVGKSEAEFTYRNAIGYSGEVFGSYRLDDMRSLSNSRLRAGIYFHQRHANTTVVSQKKMELGLGFRWMFSF